MAFSCSIIPSSVAGSATADGSRGIAPRSRTTSTMASRWRSRRIPIDETSTFSRPPPPSLPHSPHRSSLSGFGRGGMMCPSHADRANPLVSLVSGAAAKFLVVTWLVAGCTNTPTTDGEQTRKESALIVIQSYERGLAAVRAANPDVKLSLGQDAALHAESVLLVEYPAPTGNPAGRDVWCNAENADWTKGQAISFQVKTDHAIRLSVSFLDRNRVAYT